MINYRAVNAVTPAPHQTLNITLTLILTVSTYVTCMDKQNLTNIRPVTEERWKSRHGYW